MEHAAEVPSAPTPTRVERAERVIAAVDRFLGWAIYGIGMLLALLYALSRETDPHGGIYAFLAAWFVGPVGSLFLVAAKGMTQRWRTRWLWQVSPLLWPVLFLRLVL